MSTADTTVGTQADIRPGAAMRDPLAAAMTATEQDG
jgi:hypothetical protein